MVQTFLTLLLINYFVNYFLENLMATIDKTAKNPNKTTAINGKVTKPNSINEGLAQSTAKGASEQGL